MRFNFVWVGKTKDKNWRALQAEYLQRLSHFTRCEISEIKDAGGERNSKETESKRILEKVNQTSSVCLLDVEGRSLSSHELAALVETWQNQALREIVFIIGGAEGVSREVVGRANFSISLSGFTLTHEMARVVLLEQLYRAFTIIKGFPYQK